MGKFEKKLRNTALISKFVLGFLAVLEMILHIIYSKKYYSGLFLYASFIFFGILLLSLIMLRVKAVNFENFRIVSYTGWFNVILLINDEVVDRYTGAFIKFPTLSSLLPNGKKVESRGATIKVDDKLVKWFLYL